MSSTLVLFLFLHVTCATWCPCPYQHDMTCHLADAGDTVAYVNGTIYTVDSAGDPDWDSSPSQALVVDGATIVYVGTDDGPSALDPGRTVDLGGLAVLPGLHDVHMHVQPATNPIGKTCRLPPYTSPDDPTLLAVFAEDHCQWEQEGTDWVMGWGHTIQDMLDFIEANPDIDPKDILDPVVVDENGNPLPCILMERTSHSHWLNSEALGRAGLDADTAVDGNGSIYMRNAVTGELNGIPLEDAGNELMKVAYDPVDFPDVREFAYDGLVNTGLELLASSGITSALDARVFWHDASDEVWYRVANEGLLTARITLSLWAYPALDDDEQFAELRSRLDPGQEGSRIRTNHIKVYMDGILDQRTASTTFDYEQDFPDLGIGDRGWTYFTGERLAKYLTELGGDFDFVVHAIGDQGVRDALDAIKEAGLTGSRHKLSHLEIVHPDDLDRFAEMGVIADPQVAGVWTLPGVPYRGVVADLVGESRADDYVPVDLLAKAGAHLTLSSDYDVSPIRPFVGMANAANRGEQSITLKKAVQAYTINAAYSMRQEDKEADFVVLDRDIIEVDAAGDAEGIRSTEVRLPVVQGDEVWNTMT